VNTRKHEYKQTILINIFLKQNMVIQTSAYGIFLLTRVPTNKHLIHTHNIYVNVLQFYMWIQAIYIYSVYVCLWCERGSNKVSKKEWTVSKWKKILQHWTCMRVLARFCNTECKVTLDMKSTQPLLLCAVRQKNIILCAVRKCKCL
jgi:hypothetical protein